MKLKAMKRTAPTSSSKSSRKPAHSQILCSRHAGRKHIVYINRRGHLLKDSSIEWAIGVMNDGNVISDFDSDLIGEGSHSEIKVVAVSTGRQVQGIDTRVTNYGKHSIGHILQHGVIMDRSTLTFNGIGHIIKGAKGADAQQESRVLMPDR